MKKIIIISIAIITIVLIGVAYNNRTPKVTRYSDAQTIGSNVSTADGKQIIEINAKGGYSPRATVAKAGQPTILRIKTNATFDCSSSLRIPAIGYSKNLPATGTTDIELPAQNAGTTLKALCSMGMYNFSINFQG